MDVSVYPPPQPHTMLGQIYHDPAFSTNKLEGDAMFLSMSQAGLDITSANQLRVSQPPHPLNKLPDQPSQHWRRDTHVPNTHRHPWSHSVCGLGDDDFNIPPITPPNMPDHMLPSHLPHESSSGAHHPLDPPSSSPLHHLYQLQGMDPHIMHGNQSRAAMLNQDGRTLSPNGGPMTSTLSVMQQMVNTDSRFISSQPLEAARGPRTQSGMSHLSTINQSQLGLSGSSGTHNSPSSSESKSATPSPSSSTHEDENDDGFRHGTGAEKRPASVDISKKPKTPKKKKQRKDPNEPVKPVSAYALFFRDTQANIKAQNPNATFGEVSKTVASMWDGLGEEQKQLYKKRTETAKKEYLKQLAAYRASIVSQSFNDPSDLKLPHSSSSSSSPSPSMFTHEPPVYPSPPGKQPSSGSLPHPHSLPPHQHQGMYMSYHHPSHSSHTSSPGLSPHLSPPHTQIHPHLQALSSSRDAMQQPRVVPSCQRGVAASTPPHHLHSQTHLSLHSPHHQQHQHLNGHSLGSHHPSLQSDYQSLGGGGMLNGGLVMSSSANYHQLSQHTPNHHPSLDWSSDYHDNRATQRDRCL